VPSVHGCCDGLCTARLRTHGDVLGVWQETVGMSDLSSLCRPSCTRVSCVVLTIPPSPLLATVSETHFPEVQYILVVRLVL